MIERAAAVLERHSIGEGIQDGEGGGNFHCACGRRFDGEFALRDWSTHVARSLRRAGVMR